MHCTREESGKETLWSQTLKNWRRWTHQNSHRKAQCKGSVNADESSSRIWNSQNLGRRSTSETIHFNQGSSWTRRGTRSFSRRIRRTLFSTSLFKMNQHGMMRKLKNDFWSITGRFQLPPSRGIQSQTVHAERRINSCSAEVHRRDQGITCASLSLDVLLEKNRLMTHWNLDGERELSNAWTRCTRFNLLNGRPTWRMARRVGSPRHVRNKRRRTREGPEPDVCANTLVAGWHTQGKGELTSFRSAVKSAWFSHVVRGRQSSPIPAQASRWRWL